jgi:endonuclease/exonuclease/phosphatase family metal-dependent hydrolase
VRLFNFFEKESAGSEGRIIEFLKNQKPDLVCLQEFFVNGIPAKKEAEIIKNLGGKYYSHMKLTGRGKNRYYGIITLSRYPIVRKGEIIHPASSSLSIFTDIVIDRDTFRIFNNHLQSFRSKAIERSFLEEITGPGEDVAFNQVKSISSSLRKGFIQRALQASAVKLKIDESPYPVIVSGDFNDTPVSYSYRKMRKGLNDSFVISGYGAGFTYKGKYPANRIDYILFDNALESRGFDVFRVKYSDHYPVAAYFRKKN